MKELETVLTDEPGLLGPKAREREEGKHDLASLSFCISKFFVLFECVVPLNLLGVP